MHRVDEKKVSPHQRITSIHCIEAPLSDAAPGVEFPARIHAVLLKQFRRHLTRLKWNAIVTVSLVQPPRIVEQTALALQSGIKRRAGKRRQMIKRGDVE